MKMAIKKLPLKFIRSQEVEIFGRGVHILHVGMEGSTGLALWFEMKDAKKSKDTEQKNTVVEVYVLPTGYSGDEIIGASYVGAIQDLDGCVWHVYVFGAPVRR